jgi:hypothetical protein
MVGTSNKSVPEIPMVHGYSPLTPNGTTTAINLRRFLPFTRVLIPMVVFLPLFLPLMVQSMGFDGLNQ